MKKSLAPLRHTTKKEEKTTSSQYLVFVVFLSYYPIELSVTSLLPSFYVLLSPMASYFLTVKSEKMQEDEGIEEEK